MLALGSANTGGICQRHSLKLQDLKKILSVKTGTVLGKRSLGEKLSTG